MAIIFKVFYKTFLHSSGIYGVSRFKNSDESKMVDKNHMTIMKEMNADKMLILNHVFGIHIVDADQVADFTDEPDADAAATTLPCVLLTIQTADCVPVMLVSDDDKVIGAVHCSWHTAKNGILADTVALMKRKNAKNIRTNIGPDMFDLLEFCKLKLNQLGITDIIDLCEDTYAHPAKYYSYRRDVHQGILDEKTNILSTIMIKKFGD